ncbi:MAG TPA: hypothetical protein VM658_17730 [bacterium]|nr:hypothetical protein [bacterium]
MKTNEADNNRVCEAGLLVALEAFREASQGGITPSELDGVLREVTADFQPPDKPKTAREKLMSELVEFMELDLSDYAYSLATHDTKAIGKFQDRVKQWAGRLEQEAAAKSGGKS